MSDAFSEYVTLLDHVEHIPLAARESLWLSTEERAAVMARIVNFVRDGVLPQSDREEEGVEALFYSGVAAVAGDDGTLQRRRDHDAIVERIDELAHVDPRDGARVQELLYRLYGTTAGHLGEAELMVASAPDEESLPTRRRSAPAGLRSAADTGAGGYVDRAAGLVAARARVYRMWRG
jgi:hypothetical protein